MDDIFRQCEREEEDLKMVIDREKVLAALKGSQSDSRNPNPFLNESRRKFVSIRRNTRKNHNLCSAKSLAKNYRWKVQQGPTKDCARNPVLIMLVDNQHPLQVQSFRVGDFNSLFTLAADVRDAVSIVSVEHSKEFTFSTVITSFASKLPIQLQIDWRRNCSHTDVKCKDCGNAHNTCTEPIANIPLKKSR